MSPKKPAWPPLPHTVSSLLGPIPVTRVPDLTNDDGTPCGGLWDSDARTITIRMAGHPANEWHAFWHEWTHTVLDDLGVGLDLGRELEERVCDAIALARVREMAKQLGL